MNVRISTVTLALLTCMVAFVCSVGEAQIADPNRSARDYAASVPLSSKTVILDLNNRLTSLAGLDVFLRDSYRGPPIAITAECFDRRETPSLAVDAATYGTNAHLLNLTRRAEDGCSSYQVVAATSEERSASGGGPRPAAEGIAISVHYGRLSPGDGQLGRTLTTFWVKLLERPDICWKRSHVIRLIAIDTL
jgi:hypothetical protein